MIPRIEKVSKWIQQEEIDFAFINTVPNIFYLSGVTCRPYERLFGVLIFQNNDPVLICPQLEAEHVKNSMWNYEVISYTDNEDPWKMIYENITRKGVKPMQFAVEKEGLSYFRVEKLQSLFPSANVASIDEKIMFLRLIKDKNEIQLMSESAKWADFAIEIGLGALKEGRTELEVVAFIEYEQKKKGIKEMPSPPIVLFGENSSLPHGSSGNNRLKKGDFVMFDLGVKWEGYSSDITRTFIFGSGDSQQKEIYDIVLEANLKAIKNCQPGAIIGEVDKISRKIIEEAGYGKFYPHRVGHGIGLEGHESPSMNSFNTDRLIEGMIFTIEPGIYIPNVGGVRIEDEVVITEKGPELLTKHPKELRII